MPRVLFIADQFADAHRGEEDRHPGGAELTDASAIEASPWPLDSMRATDVDDVRLLDDYDVHIVGNLETASPGLIDALSERGRHVLFEHDVRICRWRGNFPSAQDPSHRFGQRCICPHTHLRELYDNALGVIFLTHRQLAVHLENPSFRGTRNAVLGSSLMNRDFFERVDAFREAPGEFEGGTAVMKSSNAIKGYQSAHDYCRERGVEPHIIRNMKPHDVLDLFERVESFVYLPVGLEPAGRMPLEARFLGCDVVVNANVGVTGEAWWRLDDAVALEVVRDAPRRFWRIVEQFMNDRDEQAACGGVGPKFVRRVTDAVRGAAVAATTFVADVERARRRQETIETFRRNPGEGA